MERHLEEELGVEKPEARAQFFGDHRWRNDSLVLFDRPVASQRHVSIPMERGWWNSAEWCW